MPPAGGPSPPLTSARMNSGVPPVRSSPRSTGRNGRGSTGAPESSGDRLGGRVRLLGRHAALFDRGGGRVAGRVHVHLAVDEPVQVGGYEALGIMLQAGKKRPAQARKAHDPVGSDVGPWHEHELAVARLGRVPAAVECDAARVEELTHRGGGGRPEDLRAAPARVCRAKARTCAGHAPRRAPRS